MRAHRNCRGDTSELPHAVADRCCESGSKRVQRNWVAVYVEAERAAHIRHGGIADKQSLCVCRRGRDRGNIEGGGRYDLINQPHEIFSGE